MTEVRARQFDIPKQDVDMLMQIEDFKGCNLDVETLDAIKPIYGLKDAPGAWMKNAPNIYSMARA